MKLSTELQAQVSLTLDRFRLEVDVATHAHVTGVFGPSGCGKTTLLECIAGLRSSAAGRVVLGSEVWQDSADSVFTPTERRGIGYVPQAGLLFPHRTVKQNLEAGFRRARREGGDPAAIYRRVIELLELRDLLKRRPATLSGGERQRVALGRALCSAPRLMLLDEPLAALDQPLRRKILPFLRSVREQFAVPMLLVSHDPVEVQALCDDVFVLRDGKVVARGTPQDVLTDPSVFAMADEQGFENILAVTVLDRHPAGTTVALGSGATRLRFELTEPVGTIDDHCFVGIPARAILIAAEKPTGLSARNIFPATIESIQAISETSLIVKARFDDASAPLAIEVGHAAVDALALRAGLRVHLIVKATSCTLYDAAAA